MHLGGDLTQPHTKKECSKGIPMDFPTLLNFCLPTRLKKKVENVQDQSQLQVPSTFVCLFLDGSSGREKVCHFQTRQSNMT